MSKGRSQKSEASSQNGEPPSLVIFVRDYGDAKIARVAEFGTQASTTNHYEGGRFAVESAVKKCAERFFPGIEFIVRNVRGGQWIAVAKTITFIASKMKEPASGETPNATTGKP